MSPTRWKTHFHHVHVVVLVTYFLLPKHFNIFPAGYPRPLWFVLSKDQARAHRWRRPRARAGPLRIFGPRPGPWALKCEISVNSIVNVVWFGHLAFPHLTQICCVFLSHFRALLTHSSHMRAHIIVRTIFTFPTLVGLIGIYNSICVYMYTYIYIYIYIYMHILRSL